VIETTDNQRVIVGLGNPGKKYEMTRHNMGYLVVKAFAQSQGWSFKEEKPFSSAVAKGKMDGSTVHLLLPMTYMNESGVALRRYIDFYRLAPGQVMVVSDDVALAYGEMRLREMGSPGGHNGLKSIEAHLGTDRYVRLRMGIKTDQQRDILADYVLDTFSQQELEGLTAFVERGATVLKRLMMGEPIGHVMSAVNAKQV
jgi:peptidyl-tRNA hydrolase, PTH1 family